MNKIAHISFPLIVIAWLFLSACRFQGGMVGLQGTSWKLVSYGPIGNQTLAAKGINTSLDFGKDGTVNGNLGCYSFSGNYQVTGGKIVFTKMISTMMACVCPQMTQEAMSLKVMNGTVRYTIAGNRLTLYVASGDSAITFFEVKKPSSKPITPRDS